MESFAKKELFGYRRSALKTALTWSAVAATALVLRVVFHWFPEWFLKCTHSQCPLDRADHVLVVVSGRPSLSLASLARLFWAFFLGFLGFCVHFFFTEQKKGKRWFGLR